MIVGSKIDRNEMKEKAIKQANKNIGWMLVGCLEELTGSKIVIFLLFTLVDEMK